MLIKVKTSHSGKRDRENIPNLRPFLNSSDHKSFLYIICVDLIMSQITLEKASRMTLFGVSHSSPAQYLFFLIYISVILVLAQNIS